MKYENEGLKQLANDISEKYYEDELEQIQKQIFNLRMGRPKYYGIYDNVSSKSNQSPKEIEKEIASLEKGYEIIESKMHDVKKIKYEMEHYAREMESLHKKYFLLHKLDNMLSYYRSKHYDFPTTEISEEYNPKYRKVIINLNKPIRSSEEKITKELYKIIKDKLSLIAFEKDYSSYTLREMIGVQQTKKQVPYDYIEFNLRKLANKDSRKYDDDLSLVGLDNNQLINLIEKMKGEISRYNIHHSAKNIFDISNNLNKLYNGGYILNSSTYSSLNKIQTQCGEILEIAREAWYLESLQNIFNRTELKDTEMYQSLETLKEEQLKRMEKMIDKLEKEYEKSNLESKIDASKKLEKYYQRMEQIKRDIEYYTKNGADFRVVESLKKEYYQISYEMIQILKINPELNKEDYNIDIESIIKKEKKELETEIQKSLSSVSDKNIEEPVNEETNKKEENINNEEIENQNTPFIEKRIIIEDKPEFENIDVPVHLRATRTAYYSEYMIEKVKQSELGKISFSKFLEQKDAYNLKELIEIEKQREAQANTIYKEYLRYLASIEEKKNAMSFEIFAKTKYNIENIDIPVQYEEQYQVMRKL